VLFHNTTDIGTSQNYTARRSERGRAPRSQGSYTLHFHAVKPNNCDSADYTVSIWTNQWYLQVFFWILDWAVHMLFAVIVYCAKAEEGWRVLHLSDLLGAVSHQLCNWERVGGWNKPILFRATAVIVSSAWKDWQTGLHTGSRSQLAQSLSNATTAEPWPKTALSNV
jgi:hypothetical protein